MTNNAPMLSADAVQVSDYISGLFAHAPVGSYASLRCFFDFRPAKGIPFPHVAVRISDDLGELIEAATAVANRAARFPKRVVCAPPVATFNCADSGKEKDLNSILALSAECDQNASAAVACLAATLGRPTLVLESGGISIDETTGEILPRLHAHWRLTECASDAASMAKAKRCRDLMARLVGADTSAVSAVHPLRLGGSWHRKDPAHPRLARIVERHPAAEIDLGDAAELLEDVARARGLDVDAKPAKTNGGGPVAPPILDAAGEDGDAIAALDACRNEGLDWHGWMRLAMALFHTTGGSAAGLGAFHRFSGKSAKYDAGYTDSQWEHLAKYPPDGRVGRGTLIGLALEQDRGWLSPSVLARRAAKEKARANGHGATAALPRLPESHTEASPQPAREQAEGSQPSPGESAIASGLGEVDAGDDDGMIEPRQWLLGALFAKTFVSALVGEGAVGKSALRLAHLLSLATGKSLTGDHVHKRSRVLIVSLEDDAMEFRRRLKAAMLHHRIASSEIKDRLFYATPDGVKLAELTQEGSPAAGRLDALIRDAIRRRGIDVVSLDPLVKAHALDENSNSAVDFLVTLLARIAKDENIAIDVLHHTRKGSREAGDIDAARGAGALINGARLAYTITRMTSAEADQFKIGERERLAYVRLDSGKVNLSAPSTEARWFKLVGVAIGNGDDGYPSGDCIQTIEPWTPPSAWEALGDPLLNEILDAIAKGLPDGRHYSAAPRATDTAAWQVVQEFAPDKSPEQAREVIKGWVKSGLLVQEPYHNPIRREDAQGLKVIDAKRPGTK